MILPQRQQISDFGDRKPQIARIDDEMIAVSKRSIRGEFAAPPSLKIFGGSRSPSWARRQSP